VGIDTHGEQWVYCIGTRHVTPRWSFEEFGMPIRFRCSRCNRLLGIARRKAGSDTRCPHCGSTITVPTHDGSEDDRGELAEIDQLLNPANAVPITPSALSESTGPPTVTRPAPPAPPVPRPTPSQRSSAVSLPKSDEDRPLFERDVDAVLGVSTTEQPDSSKTKPAATSGMDAMSLGSERGQIVLSSQKATALVVAVVVMLALAFAAGFLIASR
jgi:DNA-directed RNA polymerase subunit RPC12/RpoP